MRAEVRPISWPTAAQRLEFWAKYLELLDPSRALLASRNKEYEVEK